MYLLDTTLRDGEQAPDVCFSLEQKLQIASAVCRFGVREMEIRTPVGDATLAKETRALLQSGIGVDWLVWCRCKKEDLDAAEEAGATRVHLAYPVSDLQLATLGSNWDTAQEWLRHFYEAACKRFAFVSVGAQDASRTPLDRLQRLFRIAQDSGVQRMRIADTLGIMTPSVVNKMVVTLKSEFPNLPLEFHGHNDLGFATANALSALESGAESASATILGLGERCGNASLEQLAFALFQQEHPSVNHYHMDQIMDLCALVARSANRGIPEGQPLVGRDAIRHQSGIHVAGMLKDARSYQPFDPQIIGRSGPQLEFSSLSGRALLKALQANAGIEMQGAQFQKLFETMRQQIRQRIQGASPVAVTNDGNSIAYVAAGNKSSRVQRFSG